MVVPDASTISEAKNMPIRSALIKEGMQSFMYNAVIVQNELVGFLWFCSNKKDAFGPEHIEEGQEFANQLAIVLHQMGLIKQIEEHALDLEKQVDLRTNHLKHTMQELESFSYSVAEGLQVPLKRISAYTKALEEDFAAQLGDRGKDILYAINDRAAHMNKVITELLKLTQADNKALHKERLDMRALVQRQLNYVPEDFTVTGDALLSTQGDATLIELVWKNFIENAVKFSIPASTHQLHIGCELKGDEVIYSVQDSGVGFDSAQQDKVFDPFKRLHSAEEFEGTGIGLALTKKIILRHDGDIWAESSLGEGSTFYFSLPYFAD
jgi:light-regulated signal transduction histidine kinase (bacteriophytochrome)